MTDDPMQGLGTVERAMVQRAAHNVEVIALADETTCSAEFLATVVVRAIMMRPLTVTCHAFCAAMGQKMPALHEDVD